MPLHRPRLDFPTVNRRLKGDLLVSRPHEQPVPDDGTRDLTPGRVKTVSFPRPADPLSAKREEPPAMAEAPVAPAMFDPQPEDAAAPSAPGPERKLADAVPVGKSEAEVVTAALTPATATRVAAAVPAVPDSNEDSEASVVVAALTPKNFMPAAPVSTPQKAGDRIRSQAGAKSGTVTYALASVPQPARALPAANSELLDPIDDSNPAVRLARLYFGNNPVGDNVGAIEP